MIGMQILIQDKFHIKRFSCRGDGRGWILFTERFIRDSQESPSLSIWALSATEIGSYLSPEA
jgi:hypothetical protein